MDYHKDGMFKKVLETYTKEVVIKRLELRYESANLEISTEGEALDQEFDDFSDLILVIFQYNHDVLNMFETILPMFLFICWKI